MNQFDAARARYDKKKARDISSQMLEPGKQQLFVKPEPPRGILHLPQKKSERHNEIDVSVFVRGAEYKISMKAEISGSLMPSQVGDWMLDAIEEKMRSLFGKVKRL